jgi:hypothetical protein
MNKIKRADFMRVLDYLVFEGKYDRALNDRIDTEFTERGLLDEPCLALWLPQGGWPGGAVRDRRTGGAVAALRQHAPGGAAAHRHRRQRHDPVLP